MDDYKDMVAVCRAKPVSIEEAESTWIPVSAEGVLLLDGLVSMYGLNKLQERKGHQGTTKWVDITYIPAVSCTTVAAAQVATVPRTFGQFGNAKCLLRTAGRHLGD